MANQYNDGGVATTDRTGESQGSEGGIEQPQVYTPEELREAFREVVREENATQWNLMRQQVTGAQQLEPQLREVMDDNKEVKRLLRDVLAGKVLEPKDIQALEDAEALKEQQKQDAARTKELEDAKSKQITPEMLFQRDWNNAMDDMDQYAKDQGFGGWDDIEKAVVTIERHLAPGTDDFGLKRWKRDAQKKVLELAGKRDSEGDANTDVPSMRGGGTDTEKQWMRRVDAGDVSIRDPENLKRFNRNMANGIFG